jgi:ribonuclease HI
VRTSSPGRAARSGGGSARTAAGSGGGTAGGPARTLKAKFPGRCRCGRSYAAGEPIAKNADGWGHPDCR